ncbi:MAG: hypothetical protein WAU01_16690 [Saprospiraceae bacterium]
MRFDVSFGYRQKLPRSTAESLHRCPCLPSHAGKPAGAADSQVYYHPMAKVCAPIAIGTDPRYQPLADVLDLTAIGMPANVAQSHQYSYILN